MSSTHSSDPTEISATAQALLQAHYRRLKQGSTSSSDSIETQQSRLARLEQAAQSLGRTCLQLDNLQASQPLHPAKSSAQPANRTLQPLGPLAFWPARLVLDDDCVYVRQEPSGLSLRDQLLLEDEALPTLTAKPTSGDRVTTSVRLPEPSRTLEVSYVKTTFKDAQAKLEARKRRFLTSAAELRERLNQELRSSAAQESSAKASDEASRSDVPVVNENHEALNEEGLPFYEPVEQISEEEAMQRKQAYMQPFIRSDNELATDKEKRQQWLDDMLSKLEQEEQNERSDESDEETPTASGGNAAAPVAEAEPSANEETRVVLRTRTPSPPPSPEDAAKPKALPEIVSAARPPPPKSALKAGAARPSMVQRPSFGSPGIRRGFLNLNPSSPGAIKSSYSWEDLEKEEQISEEQQSADTERTSRSQTPTPLSRNGSTTGSSLLGRVADANSSPITSGTSTPSKKSVRIKSPERAHPEAAAGSGLTPLQRALRSSIRVKENYNEPGSPSQANEAHSGMLRQLDAGSGTAEKRHRDDVGVEEEAERIVKLLGPDVVEGHPNAPPPDVLRQMQAAHEEDKRWSTPEAIAARAKQEEEEREQQRLQRLSEKPALGHAVMERPRSTAPSDGNTGKQASSQVKAQAQQAKFSAFKQGFLNQKPSTTTKLVPNKGVTRNAGARTGVPAAPTQSLGMSALDRASLGDEELSERRQALGLPAAVPHARPSKAYAEKMRQRQQGVVDQENTAGAQMARGEVELARPVAEDDVPRPGRVRFGPPATEESSTRAEGGDDEEEQATEINPSAALENHLPSEVDDGRELDEEQEEPKIEGEGADADTDEEDAYFDSYLAKRSRRAAAADSRGLDADRDADDFGDAGTDEGEWDVEDDDDFDEDEDDVFDYDPEDLMALAPRMSADGASLAAHPELLREYEEARAKLAALDLSMPSGAARNGVDVTRSAAMAADGASGGAASQEDDDDDDYEMDVVPLDATVDDAEYQGNTTSGTGAGSRISRFKASLAEQRLHGRNKPTSKTKLEDLLSSARNLGQSQGESSQTPPSSGAFGMDGMGAADSSEEAGAPVMIIPQLAPVRFPRNGDLVEGRASGPVDLGDDESDEDDDKAEMVMRSRLERLEWKRNHPDEAKRLQDSKKAQETVEPGMGPPIIAPRHDKAPATEEQFVDEAQQPPPTQAKKVSRFKASRLAQ